MQVKEIPLASHRQRSVPDFLLLYLKGMAMGVADLVPGISGGTIAWITRIYTELVESLAALSPDLLRTLRREGFRAAWRKMHGTFLLVLLAGVFTSAISLAGVITHLLDNHPRAVWSLFFGLILISGIFLATGVGRWRRQEWSGLIGGLCAGYLITTVSPATLPFDGPADYWKLLPVGAVAFTAMILPGISGSFLLLLMGMYGPIVAAISQQQVPVLILFTLGGVGGLLLSARLLRLLLRHHPTSTLAILTGIMLGSLPRIWPWRVAVTWHTDRHGQLRPLQEIPVLPSTWEHTNGQDAALILCCGLMLAGVLIGFFPWLARPRSNL